MGMFQTLGRTLGLDRRTFWEAVRLGCAAWLAFAIATFLHIENAYWAVMPVWVVSQPARGLLIGRAVFRVVGTLVGAAFGFALMWLDPGPAVVLACLGLWIAGWTAVLHLMRGVHSYGAMLAGMTAAVVLLPSLLHPAHGPALALARVECTLIGVLVVTLVTALWTPRSSVDEFRARLAALAEEVLVTALTMQAPLRGSDERRLLKEIADLQAAAAQVTAGSMSGYRRLRRIDAFIVATLGLLAQLQRHAFAAPSGHPALEEASARAVAQRVLQDGRLDALAPATDRVQDADVRAALRLMMESYAALGAEAEAAGEGHRTLRTVLFSPLADRRKALLLGIFTGISTTLAATIAFLLSSNAGELLALGVCIFGMVMGVLPAPRRMAPLMFCGVLAGVAIATLYRFGIQPHIATPLELVLSLSPFLMLGAFARLSRRTAIPAIDANMCFLLASQAVLPAVTDARDILSGGLALILAAGLATTVVRLLPRNRIGTARRLAQALADDLARLARPDTRGTSDAEQVRRGMMRLSIHLERGSRRGAERRWSLLSALALGETIARLRLRLASAAAPEQAALTDALEALADLRRDPDGAAARLGTITAAHADGDLRVAQAALKALLPVLRIGRSA